MELCGIVIFLIFVQSSWEYYLLSVQDELLALPTFLSDIIWSHCFSCGHFIEMVLNSITVKKLTPWEAFFYLFIYFLWHSSRLTCHIHIKYLMLCFTSIVQHKGSLVDNSAKLLKLELYKTIIVHTLQPLYTVISVPGVFTHFMVVCLVHGSFWFLFGHVKRCDIRVTGVQKIYALYTQFYSVM